MFNISQQEMVTLRNKRKLAAVSRETQEHSRNSQSQNIIVPKITEEHINQVSDETEGRVTKKLKNCRSILIGQSRVSWVLCPS